MNTLFTSSGSNSSRFIATLFGLLLVFFAEASERPQEHVLLLMGDSLSAAYGVQTDTAWVTRLQQRLDESRSEAWRVVNASISGETTDGGARRLPDLLERHQPDLVIIELGGNDGLRGFQPGVIEQNLTSMIESSQAIGAQVMLVGMEIPPNYGQRYTRMFAALYPTLAQRHDSALVPFFLDDIYDQPGMMQSDGIHPTDDAQPRLLENVWPVLEPMLDKVSEPVS